MNSKDIRFNGERRRVINEKEVSKRERTIKKSESITKRVGWRSKQENRQRQQRGTHSVCLNLEHTFTRVSGAQEQQGTKEMDTEEKGKGQGCS